MILLSFTHILLWLIVRGRSHRILSLEIQKLLKFYVVTFVGSIASMFYTGMPGTWTCAAISVVLIYLDDQNREDLHGMVTAMAADYSNIYYADLDKDECMCVRASRKLNIEAMWDGRAFSFRDGFTEYARNYVVEADREAFLKKEIRKLNHPDAARIPIIALTANAFEEDVKQCLQSGMNAHLSKPVDMEQLKNLLGKILR